MEVPADDFLIRLRQPLNLRNRFLQRGLSARGALLHTL